MARAVGRGGGLPIIAAGKTETSLCSYCSGTTDPRDGEGNEDSDNNPNKDDNRTSSLVSRN